jgi:hypothetical protein
MGSGRPSKEFFGITSLANLRLRLFGVIKLLCRSIARNKQVVFWDKWLVWRIDQADGELAWTSMHLWGHARLFANPRCNRSTVPTPNAKAHCADGLVH